MLILKKVVLLLSLSLALFAKDIVVFENEYQVLNLTKKVKKLVVGNRDIMNVSVLGSASKAKTSLKLFGKKSGNTSILITYRDNTVENYHVYVNQNLGFIQKMINTIEPDLTLSKVGDGSTVISGKFLDPHEKKRIYSLLESAGIDMTKLMDITNTHKINKMIRTKLYLVEINNNRAKDLGGVTGLSYFSEHGALNLNAGATNSATFSGWLLDNTGSRSSVLANSDVLIGALNFLETKGIAKILDDTVLITTEDQNASFHVGGEVYIPIGVTQTNGGFPTIQLEEKEYGLRLTLTTDFLEKDGFMHIDVDIVDSEFDPNKEHYVNLGGGTAFSDGIQVPSFLSKDIQTDIVASTGQVIALGGRLHTEKVEAEEKIPFLGDIPLLGELFTRTVTSNKQNDLLFFLVPEIVDANEEIDDTKFYRDFSEEGNTFHRDVQDFNRSIIKPLVLEVDESMMVNEESIVEVGDNSEDIVIESENTTTAEPEYKEEEIIIEDEKSEPVSIIAPSKDVEEAPKLMSKSEASKVVVKAKEVAKPITTNTASDAKTYKITAAKIFIRTKPVNGYPQQVWIKGHKFTVDGEKIVSGITWLKIKEDCQNKCETVKNDLWVSKLHTSEI